jgi:ERCC4 domain
VETTSASTFLVARNPDPYSKLGYLLRLPLPDGPLLLKAAATWPRTAKVYCHPADEWPEDAEIVEAIPIRACRRRGVAIDLVLDRSRENRSQFVFAHLKGGREAIFWQSARTTAKARPGIRVPRRRASGQTDLIVLVDTHEQYPYRFSHQQAETERRMLPVGDYGVESDGQIVAVVERKTLADLAGSLVNGSLTYALAELSATPRAALVVEDRYADLFKLQYVQPGFVADLLAAVQVRYPTVPIIFCDTRPLAEEWTFRFLGAALAFWQAEASAEPES